MWLCLLEGSQANSKSSKDDGQWHQKESSGWSGRQTDQGEFYVIDDEVRLQSTKCGGGSEEGRRANVQCTSDRSQEERSTLHQEESDNVEERLLQVGNNPQNSELLNDGKKLLNGSKIESILFQLGKNAGFGGALEQVQLPYTSDNIVLCEERERDRETSATNAIQTLTA